MKKNALFLAAVFTLVLPVLSYGEIVDKIAVVVNDEVITNGEIDRALLPMYQQYQSIYKGKELISKLEEQRQKVIEQLIEDRLILSQAKKLNIEVDEREIDAKLNETIRRFASKEEFEQALKEQRLTAKDLRARYRDQLMARMLVDQEIGSKISVTPMEMANYYNAHADDFAQPEHIKVLNILLSPKSDVDIKKTLALAREIERRLREGGDFGALAKVYSEGPGADEGGSMGYVKRGDLMPEIEKVVFDMKVGETSGMIQTSLGYHFFRVEEKKERRILPFSEVKTAAEEAVFREKIKDKLQVWVEGLKKNAYIAFK